MTDRIRFWWAKRQRQRRCLHHWRAIGMIDWQCEICGKYGDGPNPR